MKKLSQSQVSPPSGLKPEVYNNVALDEVEKVVVKPSTDEVKLSNVPPKSLKSGYNLKKISSFKAIRHRYKLNNQTAMFVDDLQIILNEYSPEKHQLDNDLLIHILNIAESFFIYGNKNEREEQKVYAVKQLMKKYYRNDEILLETMISTVFSKVKKSNFIKRAYQRFINKFLN
jgi:hypothetical protein